MTAPALSTIGLHKSFGSLVVAQDVAITLPQGARYALIGPNGAGKTTLINLITGALRPDSGQILLGEDDITALEPDRRVKRGLARTFQINALFPDLEPLEAVTLAVCERQGVANVWWRRLAGFRNAVDEAYEILASLNLASVCHRATRDLAYGQQRLLEIALALATQAEGAAARRTGGRRAAPGRRRTVRGDRQPVVGHHRAVHRARHGGGVSLRQPRHRHGRRAPAARGQPRTRSPPIRACARSISAGRVMAETLLALDDVRAGYGDSIVLDGITLELAEGGSLAVLGRNGVGKTTLLLTIMGFTRLVSGAITLARTRSRQDRAASPRATRHRLGGAGARDLSVIDRRGEPDGRGARRPLGHSRPCIGCFRVWRSGGATWAATCRAASSRCWRSPVR